MALAAQTYYNMADFNSAIPFILSAEGGLSRNPKDTASKNPAPWSYLGKTGWHTNRGITFSTFVSMAPKLGYAVSPANFFTMPDEIWNKIYKTGYWDAIKGDAINSIPVAIALVDYAFNFGPTGALKRLREWLRDDFNVSVNTTSGLVSAINELTASDEKGFFEKLIAHRKAAYIALKQPAEENGWLERMDKLKDKGLALLSKTVVNTIKIATEHKTAITVTAFFLCWPQ
jgi:lysozyme family protein